MAKPGPKPGFKRATQEAQGTAQLEVAPLEPNIQTLSASDRENPSKLTGDALRELAHRRGLAKSQLPSMSDEKIREQLRYITYNQYENDAVA